MEKQTIEEAAVKWIRQPKLITKKESFIAGAKWRQEITTKEIDEKWIDFAEWIINDYYTNPCWEYKTIKELLEIYKKEKTL